jgi:LPS export ABC transporter protein LptC
VIVVLVSLLATLAGCSLDYEEAMVRETMADTIPDLVLYNLEHVIVSDGKVIARLEAARALQYDKRNETQLEDVHFRELDDQGQVQTEVWADRAVWHRDTEDAEATGDIYLYSNKEEASVLAQSLRWTKADRVLAAEPGDRVLLRREDGSELEGTSFRADFRSSEVHLDAARGVYVYEDQDEGAGGAGGPPAGGPDAGSL